MSTMHYSVCDVHNIGNARTTPLLLSPSTSFPHPLPIASCTISHRTPPNVSEDPEHLELAVLYLSSALQPTYYEPDADDGWQSILRRASSDYDSPEVGAVFGDYYFIESMVSQTARKIRWFRV